MARQEALGALRVHSRKGKVDLMEKLIQRHNFTAADIRENEYPALRDAYSAGMLCSVEFLRKRVGLEADEIRGVLLKVLKDECNAGRLGSVQRLVTLLKLSEDFVRQAYDPQAHAPATDGQARVEQWLENRYCLLSWRKETPLAGAGAFSALVSAIGGKSGSTAPAGAGAERSPRADQTLAAALRALHRARGALAAADADVRAALAALGE